MHIRIHRWRQYAAKYRAFISAKVAGVQALQAVRNLRVRVVVEEEEEKGAVRERGKVSQKACVASVPVILSCFAMDR
jgi:hypothetical protein